MIINKYKYYTLYTISYELLLH